MSLVLAHIALKHRAYTVPTSYIFRVSVLMLFHAGESGTSCLAVFASRTAVRLGAPHSKHDAHKQVQVAET